MGVLLDDLDTGRKFFYLRRLFANDFFDLGCLLLIYCHLIQQHLCRLALLLEHRLEDGQIFLGRLDDYSHLLHLIQSINETIFGVSQLLASLTQQLCV